MKHITQLCEPYGVNHKFNNENDFFSIVDLRQIIYTEIPKPFSFWADIDGEGHIGISQYKTGLAKLLDQFHELSHDIISGGEGINQIKFSNVTETKDEKEVKALSIMFVCPRKTLHHEKYFNEFFDQPYSKTHLQLVYRERLKLEYYYDV